MHLHDLVFSPASYDLVRAQKAYTWLVRFGWGLRRESGADYVAALVGMLRGAFRWS